MNPWCGWPELFKSNFLMMSIHAYANTHTYVFGFCVCDVAALPAPPWAGVLELLEAPRQSGSQCQHWVAVALLRSLLGERRCVGPLLWNCTRWASAWGQRKESSALMLTVFFLRSDFFFLSRPQSCLNFPPTSSRTDGAHFPFCYDSIEEGERGFGGVWKSRSAFPFPLLSAESEQQRAVPDSCLRGWALRARLHRTHLPDKQGAPPAYELCSLASLRHFSKPCYCHFSFDVQSWAEVWAASFCSQELGR